MTEHVSQVSETSQAVRPSRQQQSRGYNKLRDFLNNSMSMSHVYQPLMIRTILAGGGAATLRQLAAAFLAADLSQLEYYEQITKGYPTQTLRRHGIIEQERNIYRLFPEARSINEWERASLVAVCDAKIADYVAQRQDSIWRHRSQNFDPIPGTLRYQVLKRAMGRCEACGVSNQVRALQVDHIVPRNKGGTNELFNLQALCSLCNTQKLDRDSTDFRGAAAAYELRSPNCVICSVEGIGSALSENSLAFAAKTPNPDSIGHILLAPRRHIGDYLDLWQPELNAIRDLELKEIRRLKTEDRTISAFEIRHSISAADLQQHCYIEIIPRRTNTATTASCESKYGESG